MQGERPRSIDGDTVGKQTDTGPPRNAGKLWCWLGPKEDKLVVNAAVGIPLDSHHVLRSMLLDEPPLRQVEAEASRRLYTIRAADSEGHRSSAHILVNRMYASRGYSNSPRVEQIRNPNRVTLIASDQDMTVGTISIGFDGPDGLLVNQIFGEETESLRSDGAGLCEFIKLAVDGVVRSKRVLASLFHVAFIYAHEVKGCDRILIEVNPRHVRYYERMLGFEVRGRERLNPRVNAPAVLLSLELSHARMQIDRFGGRPELARIERSLYPHFFSAAEEEGIVHRL